MSSKSFNLIINNRISSFKKSINVDSDKSISIRSFLIGAISQNISSVKNILESEDVLSTIECLKKLGVKIEKKRKKNYLIYGKGLGSLTAKKNTELNEVYTGDGKLINSDFLNNLSTEEAKKKIIKIIEDKDIGKRNVLYRLKDWGISRQRYWGCPIPIAYNKKKKL